MKFKLSAVLNDKNLEQNVGQQDVLNVEFINEHSCSSWGDVERRSGRPSRLIVLKSLDLGIFQFLHTICNKLYVTYSMNHILFAACENMKASLFDLTEFDESQIRTTSRFEIKFHPDLEQVEFLESENLRRVSVCSNLNVTNERK